MKPLLVITAFLILTSFINAQDRDSTLPKGNSCIHLRSGKTINNVPIWRIDSLLVECVKAGNLSDVPTKDVQEIETSDYLITFDVRNRTLKRSYDLIITYRGDTISGIIRSVTDWYISYTPVKSDRKRRIDSYFVKYYMQDGQVQTAPSKQAEAPPNETGKMSGMAVADTDYYALGMEDGKKYFNAGSAKGGGIVSGIVFPFGWISAGLIAAVPPTHLNNQENPNNTLLSNNMSYYNGFRKGAHGKKAHATLGGFGIGLLLSCFIITRL